ncbi:hypothetical protein [Streptomyces sp. NRRL S-1022]|uniref:hypothetical protein n=1 Tax=Streptomyces sp. NRRL S-1022 TaxID=1463880 RepID=UPI0004BF0578|nr:hypothetical protein [Streptomyces sp. NRRL S-1022]
MGASPDDPLVPEVGPQDLGQPCQVLLFIAEEPAVMPVADAFVVRCAADDETADVPTGLAEAAGRAAPRFDDFLCGGSKVPERVADPAERRYGADQGGRAPAGQHGEPGEPVWGPVADSIVDAAVLPRRADQGGEVSDGERAAARAAGTAARQSRDALLAADPSPAGAGDALPFRALVQVDPFQPRLW